MVIIIKLLSQQKFKIIELSESYTSPCRLKDKIEQDKCYDSHLKSKLRKFFRTVIDQMVKNEINIKPWDAGETTNRLHERIIKCARDQKVDICMIELDKEFFSLFHLLMLLDIE